MRDREAIDEIRTAFLFWRSVCAGGCGCILTKPVKYVLGEQEAC